MKNFQFEVVNGQFCFAAGKSGCTYLQQPVEVLPEEFDSWMTAVWRQFQFDLCRCHSERPVILADIVQKMVEDEDDPALMDDFDLYPWERFRGSDPCYLAMLLAVLQESGGRIPSGYIRHPSRKLISRYYAWLLKASQTEGVKKVPITL